MAVRRSGTIGAALVAVFALALAGAPALGASHEEGEPGAGMEEGADAHEGTEKGAHGDLAKRVSEEIGSEEGLSGVRADAKEGTITLRGTVAKSAQRERAEELASGIEGVDSVRNEIEIDVASPPAEGSGGSGY